MNNLYRKMPIFVQNRFNRFHHFSIGFTQVSDLFQPFAVGSNEFLAYYGLCHCFFTGFQQLFQSIATMGCHQLFNLAHSFSAFFHEVFAINLTRSSLFKSALSGAGSDQLPSWNDFVIAIFFPAIFLFFFYISLFLEMAVQDEQWIQKNANICSE